MLLYSIMIMTIISCFLIFYLIFGIFIKNRKIIAIRLARISKEGMKGEEDELSQPLFTRIIRPTLDEISKVILRITPREFVSAFEKKVLRAGSPLNLSVKDWINIQVAIVISIPLLAIFFGYLQRLEIRTVIFISALGMLFGTLLPNLILNQKASDRQKKIINSLPDILDLLTVSVEAGLGFDGALVKVIDKMPGPLASEFENVLQEIKVGKQKRDALRDMAERIAVQDLTTFIGSIIQADQLGVSIGNVLRIQSEQIRQKRRQRAQEKAMKAPVKMLIPMVLFIFPTIFSVLIGPVAIRVIRTFIK